MDAVETYRRIADVLRSAQRIAIETENAPNKRKRLRTFSTQEVATLLGVKARDITAYTKTVNSREGGQRNRLSFEELLGLRRARNELGRAQMISRPGEDVELGHVDPGSTFI